MPREHVTYGLGGYDPKKPDGNVVAREVIPDDPEDVARQDARATLEKQLSTKADPSDKEYKDAVARLLLDG